MSSFMAVALFLSCSKAGGQCLRPAPRWAVTVEAKPFSLEIHAQISPGFTNMPAVVNGFSDLIIEVWGREAGRHGRSAVGVAELPFGIPVEIEAEVLIRPQ